MKWQKNTIALFLILCAAFYFYSSPSQQRTLVMDISALESGDIQFYFDFGAGFSEADSVRVKAPRGNSSIELDMPSGILSGIRIDPSAIQSSLTICNAYLLLGKDKFDINLRKIDVANETTLSSSASGDLIIKFDEKSIDPYVAINLPNPIKTNNPYATALFGFFCMLIVIGFGLLVFSVISARAIGAYGLATIVLAFAMASATPLFNPHPDEPLHRADASYFTDNSLPPSLKGDGLMKSYTASPFGVSYLFEWNIVYLLAGKFANFLDSFSIEQNYAYRLFNVTLLGLIITIGLSTRSDAMYLLPILIVPQAWYVFSYFNGDGLPLALSFLIVILGTRQNGGVNNFLNGNSPINSETALFAIALSLLILSKKNYYVVILFIILWHSISIFRIDGKSLFFALFLSALAMLFATGGQHLFNLLPKRISFGIYLAPAVAIAALVPFFIRTLNGRGVGYQPLLRTLAVYGAAVTLALPWILTDTARNGFGVEKSSQTTAIIETYAAPAFKPSTIAERPEESYFGLRWADKGRGITEPASAPYYWFGTTFKSFYATFGYMQFYASEYLYYIFLLVIFMIFLTGIFSRIGHDRDCLKYVFLAFTCSGLLICSSYLHSWTYDFQPQGRYILGILPILSPLGLVVGERPMLRKFSFTIATAGFIVAAAIFVNVGLANTVISTH